VRLHGREAELAAIGRAVAAVRCGGHRALAISGESGIGKSALLGAAAAEAAAAALLVLRARAAEREREVPFGLVVDALDDEAGVLGAAELATLPRELAAVLPVARGDGAAAPVTGGPAERFRYHRALRALLERLGGERPLALLLDDVQWADEGSVELLLHLLRRPPRVPFLLLLALRPSRGGARLLDAGRRRADGWDELRPAPLGRAAARALLGPDLEPAARERILREADGNPLFLRELARGAGSEAAHGEPLPETLGEAFALELEGLEEPVRRFLDGAAVAGDPFDVEVAAAAAGLDDPAAGQALDALLAADVVRPASRRAFGFRHPLVHRIVTDAIPPEQRRAAHRRAAAALAARGAAPALRAHHVEQFAAAGDEDAIALFAEAAQASLDGAPSVAAHWYGAALALLGPGEEERRAQLLAPMALALGSAGRLDASRAAFDDCLALLPPSAVERRAALIASATIADALLGAFAPAAGRLGSALEQAPPSARPRLLHYRAAVSFLAGDGDDGLDWADRAARELDGCDAEPLRAAIESAQALGRALRGEPGGELAARAERRLRETGDAQLAGQVDAAWSVGGALVQLERFAAAAPVLRRGMRLARQPLESHLFLHFHVLLTMSELPLLELGVALEHSEAAEEVARLQGLSHELAFALTQRARVLALRGQRTEARAAAAESEELLRAHPLHGWSATNRAHNAVVLDGGDPERMLAALTKVGGPGLERIDRAAVGGLLANATRAALAAGRRDDAQRWADLAAAAAGGGDLPATAVRAERAAAELLLAAGATGEARRVAAGAVGEAVRHGLRQEELEAALLHGRALLAAGEREQAIGRFQRVAEEAARHGALSLHAAAARELTGAGARLSAGARRAADAAAGDRAGVDVRGARR
jgi:AAA ATPase domain